MTVPVWKFLVAADRYVPLPDDASFAFKGCLAVAAAANEWEAKELIKRYGTEFGMDTRWLVVATVIKLGMDATAPGVIAMAML